MPATKEIRDKIESIKKTQKTTRAMEMVAVSKMRKAQERMNTSRPYAKKIRDVIAHLAQSHSEYHHVYMKRREIKNVGYIIVSTDRGLCGGLNVNMFRSVLQDMQQWQQKEVGVNLCLIGRKAEGFFKRIAANVLAVTTHLGDAPKINDLIGVVRVMLEAYEEERIDALYIVSNEFVNTMTQSPVIQQLLPLASKEETELKHHWDYIYEPDAKELLDRLLKRYMESQVYQSVIENLACQQAATMVAMKSASDNAGDLIKDLQLVYNKARQAAITQEISEIVGGAEAV